MTSEHWDRRKHVTDIVAFMRVVMGERLWLKVESLYVERLSGLLEDLDVLSKYEVDEVGHPQ